MSQLHLSLLGTPEVKHGEQILTFSTRKALALLVYLAVEGGTHARKTLSESFWPELDAEHGRAALRATLLELRKLLDRCHKPGERAHLPELLLIRAEEYRFRALVGYTSITTRLYHRNPCNWARSRLRWEQ